MKQFDVSLQSVNPADLLTSWWLTCEAKLYIKLDNLTKNTLPLIAFLFAQNIPKCVYCRGFAPDTTEAACSAQRTLSCI